ncbi:hypothetical protein DBN64_03545 [Enterococcus faecalis]|uniref:hypothetical protein n=2 Tax=Enterococcus faecalis TaxID=1351 RepID=UPI00046C7985|nr:hypothetical protein [Enterococcus faecalis]EGO8408174.1 hypothetical protein [Enterococcus faecalis]EGO9070744.1 hypothetical protein [Enterococcus faecalis]EGO9141548.1 hypothetical protein [Enterococcus faecalis]NRD99669.1 hypothetical protein [Enterococcus faecalis]NRE01622.1 hypothetical protein [Enterococcus faecalis]
MKRKLTFILRKRILSSIVWLIIYFYIVFTHKDYSILLGLILLSYLYNLEIDVIKNGKIQTWPDFKNSVDWPFFFIATGSALFVILLILFILWIMYAIN